MQLHDYQHHKRQFSDGQPTLRVVAVDTSDVDAYVAEVRKGRQIMMKVAPKMVMRAWRATFAGDAAGTVIVGVEHRDIFLT